MCKNLTRLLACLKSKRIVNSPMRSNITNSVRFYWWIQVTSLMRLLAFDVKTQNVNSHHQ